MKLAIAVGAVLAAMAGLASCSHPSAAPHSATSTAAGVPRHAPTPAVVASGLHFPVNLTFDQHGGLWFTSSARGHNPTDGVWYIPPGGRPRQIVKGLAAAGLAWVGNSLYVASTTVPGTGEITVLEGFNGSRFTSQRVRLDGLTVGEHTIGSIALGPDGQLYIGVGAVNDHNGPPGSVLVVCARYRSPRGEGDRPGERLRTRVLRPAPARDRCRARRPWRLPAARGAERVQPGRPGGQLRLPWML